MNIEKLQQSNYLLGYYGMHIGAFLLVFGVACVLGGMVLLIMSTLSK